LCAVALLSSIGDPGSSTALALAFAGATLGFLRFNTFPASVFMGDAGSQLLGFTVGVLSVRATQSATSQISAALPVLLLALPILDTLSVMMQRIGEGRSPFSADKNHIHHKLLAMGFFHHEAVMVIYTIQAGLLVLAYFLRYESDAVIVGVVVAFFAFSISLFQWTTRTGWRIRALGIATGDPQAPKFFGLTDKAQLLPRLSYAALAMGLAVYACVIVLETAALSSDIGILIGALLAVTLGSLVIVRAAPVSIIEKGVLFVTATLLVYVDALVLPANPLFSGIGWFAVGIVAISSAVRLRLFNDRRFELTPLDIIVLFMALVVPSLIGNLPLPLGGSLAIAKLVILLYGIEMLVNRSEGRAVWVRVAAVSVLAALAMRSLASL
jgi:UDP-GlcNAc:undecaprenyl-phosphate GlcNAc-1-phosphate transferase